MEFKNEYIIIVIIIIITIFFIINYDIYVLPKNELLCKPVYVTKKIINDKMIKKLNNPKESFTSSKNKIKQENEFNQVENELIKEENELNQVENKLIKEENMNHTNKIIRKKIIINNIFNILSKIPTVLKDDEIHNIINHISNIYLNSTSIDKFYNDVNKSNKITKNNLSYIKLILYLIDNFDSSLPVDIEPLVDKEQQIVKETPFNKQSPNKNNYNTFLIDKSNSPTHNRMMEQANFIH
jgi:hypothetical protein